MFRSYGNPDKTFNKKMINTPNIKGSVGSEIPNPASKLRILMANGVKKVMSNRILSRAKT